MLVWLLLALGAAITNSWTQAIQKWAITLSRYSKITISFVAVGVASTILFFVSYFFVGIPQLQSGFWTAVLVTGILNTIAFPIMLRAYQLGEFSSVYSMILLTPVFMFLTSFIFLGELPSWLGGFGVVLTVLGLLVVTRVNHEHVAAPDFKKGNLLGVLVAMIYSVTTNFDKLAAVYSDRVFGPAAAMAVMAASFAIYLLIKHRTLFVKLTDVPPSDKNSRFLLPGIFILLSLGLVMALSNVLHVSALTAGFASYTIAVKRTGVLFGVFWGWLFFKEKNIAKKLIGVAVAIGGVILILFS